ncbi:cupin domain-containing protein [Treponema phagedenis]|uniref:cupin domain-containing protein n=1 Tax=Treponema phagedenis TaxID=162 RepID=UPI001AF75BF6|nr:cupin domain-containing protein [Treponema phagedenis]QSH95055.1 DUF1637 domain-containing protein [Treponema phagedenis]
MNSQAKIGNTDGLVFEEKKFLVARKTWKKGDTIPKHNHEGMDVIFSVIKGKVSAHINEAETHELTSGMLMYFDGKNYISGEILEDTMVHIVQIKQAVTLRAVWQNLLRGLAKNVCFCVF